MLIVKYRNVFFAISALILAASIGAVLYFGLTFGIDFTGGALAEIAYEEPTEKTMIEASLNEIGLGAYSLRASGDNGYLLRTRALSESEHGVLLGAIAETGGTIERFNEVGPTIGQELRSKALVALILVVLAIALYVAFAFRHVSKPVSSWVYGLITIGVLLHDVLIPVGLFAVLGFLFGAEVDVLFVVALLVILGYSVNDTIVVFDRVREALKTNHDLNRKEDFELTVGAALKTTYARSINTSLTTLITLVALLILGGSVTQYFALVLIVGILAGTYSSIFLAAPLLVAIGGSHSKGV